MTAPIALIEIATALAMAAVIIAGCREWSRHHRAAEPGMRSLRLLLLEAAHEEIVAREPEIRRAVDEAIQPRCLPYQPARSTP